MAILDMFGLGGQTPFPTNQSPVDYNNLPTQPQGVLNNAMAPQPENKRVLGFADGNDAFFGIMRGLAAASSQDPIKTAMMYQEQAANARKLSLEEARAKKPNLTPTGQPGVFLAVYPDGRQETVIVDEAVKAAADLEDRKDKRQQNQFAQQNNMLDKRMLNMVNIAAMKNNKSSLPASLQKSEDTDQEAITGYESNVGMIRPVISNLTRGEDGKAPLELGPARNAYNASRNFFGKSTPESQRYQELEETKTRIVNESLRLNKGTQTEGDAQRAAKELEAAWAKNDTEAARKAFERLEEININAANNKALLINKRRQAQNLDPLYNGPAVSPRAPAGTTSTGVKFTIER